MGDQLEYMQNQVQFQQQLSVDSNRNTQTTKNNYFANLQHFNSIGFHESQDNFLGNIHYNEASGDANEAVFYQQEQVFQNNQQEEQQQSAPFRSQQDIGQEQNSSNTSTTNKQQLPKQQTKKLYEPLIDNGQVYVFEDNPEEYKKARKRIQNRYSARKVRGIQKNTTINLESQWDNLQKENYSLRIQIADLTASNKLLSEEIAYFRSVLKPNINGHSTYQQDHSNNNNNQQQYSNGTQSYTTQQQLPQQIRQDQSDIQQGQQYNNGSENNKNNNYDNRNHNFNNSKQYDNTEDFSEIIDRDQDQTYLPYTATRTDPSRKGISSFNSYQLFALALISCLFMLGYSGSTSDEGSISTRQQHYNVILQYEQSINSVKDINEKQLSQQLAGSVRYLVDESKQFEAFKILLWTLGIAGYIAYAVFVVLKHFKSKQILNKQKRQ